MTQQRWDELVEDSVGGDVTAGTMFGSKGLRTGKKFFAIWWHEQLVLKLPPAQVDGLVQEGKGALFEPMEGRPMNGWVVVDGSADWTALSTDARAWVASQQR
jgi:TfoX/Sxy family transcriptional regulator of competence genes